MIQIGFKIDSKRERAVGTALFVTKRAALFFQAEHLKSVIEETARRKRNSKATLTKSYLEKRKRGPPKS